MGDFVFGILSYVELCEELSFVDLLFWVCCVVDNYLVWVEDCLVYLELELVVVFVVFDEFFFESFGLVCEVLWFFDNVGLLVIV